MNELSPAMARRHRRACESLHPTLLTVLDSAFLSAQEGGCVVYCFWGFRGRAVQNTLKKAGRSNAGWMESWHNVYPSLAMDIVPVWSDKPRKIEWSSDRTKHFLQTLAKENPWLTWGHHLFKGDIYHFQVPAESGPHKFDVDWDKPWDLVIGARNT